MTQYIERSRAIDVLINNTSLEGREFEEAENAMCAIPGADVRPVARGKWMLEKITDAYGGDVWNRWRCSECDAVGATGWEHTRDGDKPKHNFCPNCGAKMDGGPEE